MYLGYKHLCKTKDMKKRYVIFPDSVCSHFDYQDIVYGINNGANTRDLLIRN